jgi:hypothetical protein
MADVQSISDHWGTGDVFDRIMKAMEAASISPNTVTGSVKATRLEPPLPVS